MTNEALVAEIQANINVSENMEKLYMQNVGLFKKWCLPYSRIEPLPDLLQECYFALCKAVSGYDESKSGFTTYLQIWVRAHILRYLADKGSVIRLPAHTREAMLKYKRTIGSLEKRGIVASDDNIACEMGVSLDYVKKLRRYALSMASLDAPIADADGLTLADGIADDANIEEMVIDDVYADEVKAVWDIAKEHTSPREFECLERIYKDGATLRDVAQTMGFTHTRAAQLRDHALKQLRKGKAYRQLKEQLEICETVASRGCSLSGFRHSHTSAQEKFVLIKEQVYQEYLARIGAKTP